jgi:hypothetical protein
MAAPRNAVATNRGRIYRWKGEDFLSVTNALGALAKPALPNWAAKSVAEYVIENLGQINAMCNKGDADAALDVMKRAPWRTRDRAADIGTALHAAAEAHVLGTPTPEPAESVAPLLGHFVQFLADYKPEYECAECSVYNRAYFYAGTLDALCRIDGELWLIDYKTSEKGPFPESALQLASYAGAEFIGAPDGSELPMPQPDHCGVLKVTAGGYELYPVKTGPEIFRSFLYVLQMKRWVDSVAGECIQAPLPRRTAVVV